MISIQVEIDDQIHELSVQAQSLTIKQLRLQIKQELNPPLPFDLYQNDQLINEKQAFLNIEENDTFKIIHLPQKQRKPKTNNGQLKQDSDQNKFQEELQQNDQNFDQFDAQEEKVQVSVEEVQQKEKKNMKSLSNFLSDAPSKIAQRNQTSNQSFAEKIREKNPRKPQDKKSDALDEKQNEQNVESGNVSKSSKINKVSDFLNKAPELIKKKTQQSNEAFSKKLKPQSSLQQEKEEMKNKENVKEEDKKAKPPINANSRMKKISRTDQKSFELNGPKKTGDKELFKMQSGELNPLSKKELYKKVYYSPEANQKAQDLIKKMNFQRVTLENQKKKQQEAELEQYKQQEEQRQEKNQNQDEQEKELKRKQIQERMEEVKQLKEMKAKINKDGNKLIKQIQTSIKTQEEIQKKKEDDLIKPELERRKNELQRKRELSQPIRMDQLIDHQKKYQDDLRQREYERAKVKLDAEIEHKSKVQKFPKSQALLRIEEIDKIEKDKRDRQLDIKKLQKQRQQKYVEVIKDMFPAQSNLKKQEFFGDHPQVTSDARPQSLPPIKNLNKKSQSPRLPNATEIQNINIKGFLSGQSNLRRLEKALGYKQESQLNPAINQTDYSINMTHEDHNGGATDMESENRVIKQSVRRRKKNYSIDEKSAQQLYQQPAIPQPPKPKDYLTEQRLHRLQNGGPAQPADDQWLKIIQNETLPANARYQSVLTSVQKLEQRAQQKEKLATYNRDADAEEEANQLYINSIKAKLALLGN